MLGISRGVIFISSQPYPDRSAGEYLPISQMSKPRLRVAKEPSPGDLARKDSIWVDDSGDIV